MVQLLLEHRADTAPRDEAGRCALQYALCSRLQRCAELLLAHAHDPTPPGLARNNQLLSSSAEGDAALARQLISAHADVNFVDPQLRTPLLRGASAGHLPTLHVLMKYGANPRMADEGGQTALMGAVLGAHVETVEALLAYCRTFEGEEEDGVKRLDFANINSAGESTASLSPPPTEAPRVGAVARSPAERQVSFRCGAVFFDQSGIAYEYQADNDAESSLSPHSVHSTLSALSAGSGFPSMTRAGSGNTGSVSDSSVSANASPSPPPLLTADSLSAVDSGPGSPLPTLAAAHTPIPQEQPPAPARRARGAVVDVVDADHRSALMLAAGRGDKELVKILLAHKANVSIVDFNNDTALTIAIKNRHVKVAKKLIGAMPDGDTKLDCSNIIFHSILQPMELDDRRTLVKLLMGKRLHGHETLKYLLKKL
jgi:ankyrin repeat protein